MSPKLKFYLPIAGIFFVTTGLSFVVFGQLFPSSSIALVGNNDHQSDTSALPSPAKTGFLTFEGPRTEVCPLNGALYTKSEKDLWSDKRPLLVMIENHQDSRPQSGLDNADIVYEAVAEGGITRFMAVYYCAIQKGAPNRYDVGPVRSARTYFLDLASEYADYPLYTHVGGANCSAAVPGGPCTTYHKAQAIEQISRYGWTNKGTWGDLSQFSLSYKVCRREPDRTGEERATEHTMFCSSKELWNTAADRGLTNETLINKTSWDKNFRSWNFDQSDKSIASPTAPHISFSFWAGSQNQNYAVAWNYQSAKNIYLRQNGGQPHIDFNTGEVITAKNIIVQLVKETRSVDEHMHNLYDVIGSGTGYLFQNGDKIDITWTKTSRTARTIFKDKTGQEVKFVPGTIWIEILPKDSLVKYEDPQQS